MSTKKKKKVLLSWSSAFIYDNSIQKPLDKGADEIFEEDDGGVHNFASELVCMMMIQAWELMKSLLEVVDVALLIMSNPVLNTLSLVI